MIPIRAVALALADTLLAGGAGPAAMVDGAVRAFGRTWPFIGPLCTAIAERTGEHFHHFSREELAGIILDHEDFQQAWEQHPVPQIRRYCLELPIRPAPPDWLAAMDLPPLPTVADLVQWLGLATAELDWFADRWRVDPLPLTSLQHYHYRWIGKRSGGWRLIEIPKPRLRAIQRQILRSLLDRVPPHGSAHGFRRAHSCKTHAGQHTGRRVVIRMDLKDFFPSIRLSRVHALFAKLGYSASVAGALARLCVNRTPAAVLRDRDIDAAMPWTERKAWRAPHLPQGSPCSPALANLCAYRLDLRLEALASSLGAVYTRYADDLAFSGGRELERALDRLHAQVAAIALEEGFAVNTRKTRMMRAGTRQQLTGIVVNRHTNLARDEYDLLKAILTNCLRHGPASQNRDGKANFRAWLDGRIAHASMLNPLRGARLRQLFDRIAWNGPGPDHAA